MGRRRALRLFSTRAGVKVMSAELSGFKPLPARLPQLQSAGGVGVGGKTALTKDLPKPLIQLCLI